MEENSNNETNFFKKLKYNADGLMTIHNCSFMDEPRFINAYNIAYKIGLASDYPNVKIHWRAHVVLWAAKLGIQRQGVFVECGVNRGFFASLIYNYYNFGEQIDKEYWMFDTFSGFDERFLLDEEKSRENIYTGSYEDIVKNFGSYKNIVIIRGSIPDILSRFTREKVSYLLLDMNCSIPEIEAAKFFWDKIVSGGVIVLDDYNYAGYETQHAAFNKFAAQKDIKILALPTGQGIIIKP
jgi:hypothetical protein